MQINTDNEVYKDGFPVGKLNEKGEVEYFDEKPKENRNKRKYKGKIRIFKRKKNQKKNLINASET